MNGHDMQLELGARIFCGKFWLEKLMEEKYKADVNINMINNIQMI
jgi:hypothetical protein